MPKLDPKEIAVEMTFQAQRHSEITDTFVRNELTDVFGGTLYTISWKGDRDPGKSFDNLVFNDGKKFHHFNNPTELMRFLSQKQPRDSILTFAKELLVVGGAPALIAIVITATICWLAVSPNGKPAPDILGHALTTILGFYFGRKANTKPDSGT